MAPSIDWSSGRPRRAVVLANAAGASAAAAFAAVGVASTTHVKQDSPSSPLASFWAASSAVRTWAVVTPLLAGLVRGGRPAPELLAVAGLVQIGDAALGVWQRNARMAILPAAMGLVHLQSARLLAD